MWTQYNASTPMVFKWGTFLFERGEQKSFSRSFTYMHGTVWLCSTSLQTCWHKQYSIYQGRREGLKIRGPELMRGNNLPSLVEIGFTDLPKIWGCHGTPGIPRDDRPASIYSSDSNDTQNTPTKRWGIRYFFVIEKKFLK